MKRKIIILAGKLNSPFIINELPIIREYFDEVYIVSYKDDKATCDKIADIYKIRYEFVSLDRSFVQFLKKLWKWLRCKHVKEEFNRIRSFSLKGLMKAGYLLWYGIYAIQSYENIKHEIKSFDGEVYLYAYWLSRPAYVVSLFNCDRDIRIKKIFSRAHGYDLYEERNRVNYLPFRIFLDNNLDMISFISKNGKKYYVNRGIEEYSIGKSQYKVSYLGTYNTKHLQKKICEKNLIVIASCSAIIGVKRLDLIIRVIKYLQRFYKIKWIHYGSGKLEEEIGGLAKKELDENSYIFKGQFDNGKLLQDYIIEDVDYFINMSDSEGLPVSIMEAMSVGIPVLARDVGGISEIVTKETGLLLAEKWTEKEKERIIGFFEKMDDNRYKKISASCFHKWNELFNADINYRKFFEGLEE